MNQDYAERRTAGASHEQGLGQTCAHVVGAISKNTNQGKELALSAGAGSAATMSGTGGAARWSDEPMPRANHKAKRHGRPVATRHKRQRNNRWALLEAGL